MKPNFFLLAIALFTTAVAHAQFSKTVTLTIDECNGKDAILSDCAACGGWDDDNFGTHQDLMAASWTVNGNLSNARTFFDFNLSGIPANATITSATLYLYHNPASASGNTGHSQLDGTNEAWLQRITSTWDENLITWNNKPATTTQNQVVVAASSSNTQNYQINVATLLQDMVNNPTQSFGFAFQLQTESPRRSLLFASSDHPNAALHPKLEITYTTNNPATCLSLQPHNTTCDNGKDAVLSDCAACGGWDNDNFGANDDFMAATWTVNGNKSTARSLLSFDLASVPANATVTSATLYLYHNPSSGSGNIGHSQLDGTNAGWLQRITSNWDENTVTWNNKPTTTTQNQVSVVASTSNTENYVIDVATLVQDMVSNPSQSFGFSFQLNTELPRRSLLFASSDHPNTAIHPKLELCYTVVNSIKDISLSSASLRLYPNPINGNMFFVDAETQLPYQISDLAGRIVKVGRLEKGTNNIILEEAKGVYLIKAGNATAKFILQ
jgi:hypothetical protein